jgi:AraC family transcriptional activator of pobA
MLRPLNSELPLYPIDTFYEQPFNTLNFEIKIIEDTVQDMLHFAKTPHRHDCFLILLITNGKGTHTIDSITYKVRPFALYFIMPGQVHSWSFSEDVKGFALFFKLDFYTNYTRERHLGKNPLFNSSSLCNYLQLDPKAEGALVNLLDLMHGEFQNNNPGREEVLRNGLDMLLVRIARYCDQNTLRAPIHSLSQQVARLQRLIETNFREMRLPNEYAEKMNISPKHLNALCKRTLNKTVTDLIHERVILEAKRLLAFTDLRIKEVADDLGFNDKSYFLRFFKKRTGVTPEQFRKDSSNKVLELSEVNLEAVTTNKKS